MAFQQSGKNWKITIDKNSLSGGWGDTFGVSISNAIETSDKKYSKSIAISLFRLGFEGHIAPGEDFTALTDTSSTFTSLPLNSAVTEGGGSYRFFTILKNGRIVNHDDNTLGVNSKYDPTSATETENADIVSLYDVAATPVEYLIYSYDIAANGFIAYITPDFSTAKNDTWVNVTQGVPHKFSFGPTKNDLYFTNGQYIGTITISGALASASTNVNALNLGSGWIATSICPYGNYEAIVGHRKGLTGLRGESRLWLWDGYSPDPNFLYDLNDDYVTVIKNDNGILKIWTQGRNNTTKIKYFTGTRVETIFESAQIGSPPRHGTVDVFQNIPHWVGKDGQALYCLDGKAFHCRTLIATGGAGSASDVGMVKNLSTNALYIGIKTGSSYKIYIINHSNYYLNADFRTRLFSEIPPRSKITKFKIYFSQFGTGASILLSLFKDYTTASLGGAADQLNTTISYAIHGNIRYYSFEKLISDLNSFYTNIRFNHAAESNTAAIIRKVEIFGEATDMY